MKKSFIKEHPIWFAIIILLVIGYVIPSGDDNVTTSKDTSQKITGQAIVEEEEIEVVVEVEETEEQIETCNSGFLEEYRCYGDFVQQKYQYLDCGFTWMDKNQCAYGCLNGVCKPEPEPKQEGVCSCSVDLNCADFNSHAEAQDCFEYCQPGDPHGLDRDKDGLACEGLN